MSSPSLAPGKPCPICGKPAVEQFRPFCSKRCADVDLNRWLSGVYSVPVVEREDDLDRDAGISGDKE
jgi:endogenous inhibitor of DNA gyrase (YacG/DUF329 family)